LSKKKGKAFAFPSVVSPINYWSGGEAAVGAVPSVVKRITPVWSVKKPRLPVPPIATGVAVMV
jgi:hypothetical protein